MAAASDTVATFESRRGPLQGLQHFLHGNPAMVPIIILAVSVAAFGVVAGERFFSAFNLSLIIQQVTVIGFLACAQTLIILTAGIDLSVGAIMMLSAVVMGKFAVSLGVEAIAQFAEDGTLPEKTEGKDFTDTGVALVTDDPQEGVESISVEEGLEKCWG